MARSDVLGIDPDRVWVCGKALHPVLILSTGALRPPNSEGDCRLYFLEGVRQTFGPIMYTQAQEVVRQATLEYERGKTGTQQGPTVWEILSADDDDPV